MSDSTPARRDGDFLGTAGPQTFAPREPEPTLSSLRVQPSRCLTSLPGEGVCFELSGHLGPCVPSDRRAAERRGNEPATYLRRGPLSDRERELIVIVEELLAVVCLGPLGEHAAVHDAQKILTKVRMEIRPTVASRLR